MKIKLYARTDRAGSRVERTVEWDDEDWNSMSERDQHEAMLDEFWNQGLVEWGFEPVE